MNKILVLGASNSSRFHDIKDDDTWMYHLAEMMPDDYFYNAAVEGITLFSLSLFFDELIKSFKPTILILEVPTHPNETIIENNFSIENLEPTQLKHNYTILQKDPIFHWGAKFQHRKEILEKNDSHCAGSGKFNDYICELEKSERIEKDFYRNISNKLTAAEITTFEALILQKKEFIDNHSSLQRQRFLDSLNSIKYRCEKNSIKTIIFVQGGGWDQNGKFMKDITDNYTDLLDFSLLDDYPEFKNYTKSDNLHLTAAGLKIQAEFFYNMLKGIE
tara:strand:+ start:689 stop:1513 length:825 start_codon:yes stop_codon:yes gene_type:complete